MMDLPPGPLTLQLDAINLLLRDLGVVDEALEHRAAFHGCSKELADLRVELVNYLRHRKSSVQTIPRG
jgi:hypothetical protein